MQIGENIARRRREARLTQEQLGNLVSVSAQAVSKWENGGMPDAELLPTIADALGVTVDTLFGRENMKSADMNKLFFNWYMGMPEERRQYALFKLLLLSQTSPVKTDDKSASNEIDALSTLPLKTANGFYKENGETVPVWLRSEMMDDFGMRLSIPAEDCPLFMVLPEPEGGYRSILPKPETYRTLFSVLAKEGGMELLYFLYSRPIEYYSTAVLSRSCCIEESRIIPVLDAMCALKLINKRSVEETDGKHSIYALNESPGFVPFLLFARWIMTGSGYIWRWANRSKPLLKKETDDDAAEA